MTEYRIQSPGRVCHATGRELRPGEQFWTALIDEAGQFVRREYAADAWHGPPGGAFSYWAGRVPAPNSRRAAAIDDELLLDCFRRLADHHEPAKLRFRFVVALLLMRRKRLKFEDTVCSPEGDAMLLRDSDGETHTVADPGLDDDALAAVQDEVFRLLGWE